MNFSRILIPIAVIAFVAGAWHQYKWPGVAVSTGAVVMWILLHFTRMVTVLSRASNRPVGHVSSAVMLNAKLKKGVNLITDFRDSLPAEIQAQTTPYINNVFLTGLMNKKNEKGKKEHADYVKSKIASK